MCNCSIRPSVNTGFRAPRSDQVSPLTGPAANAPEQSGISGQGRFATSLAGDLAAVVAGGTMVVGTALP